MMMTSSASKQRGLFDHKRAITYGFEGNKRISRDRILILYWRKYAVRVYISPRKCASSGPSASHSFPCSKNP